VTDIEFLRRTPAGTLDRADAARVVDLLDGGGLAVLPTETGYLIAADATNLDAVRKVFHAKRRSLTKPMHVACSSVRLAAAYAELGPFAVELLNRFTPGPLTVVVPRKPSLPDTLVTLHGTVGIRVPDHPVTLRVVESLGRPVTATSLNRSGEESRPLDRGYLRTLDWPAAEVIAVVEDPDSITETLPSTLVRITTGRVEVLREGPISEAAVRQVEDDFRIRAGADHP
jgi:L-threonylcarbamoyladenylate synthase